MKLHGNAALSWHGRRRLAERVVERGMDADGGGRGGRRQRALRSQVGWLAIGWRASAASHDRSSAPQAGRQPHPAERVEAIVALRRLRFTAAEIAETLGMALSTVSAILRPRGLGRLGRLGLEQPLRYERSASGRARARRRQAARPDRGRCRLARLRRRAPPAAQPRAAPTSRVSAATGRLRVRARLRRRLQPARLRRGAPGREGDDSDRLPAPRGRLLPPSRHPGRAAPDRQRLGLRLDRCMRSPAAASASGTCAPDPTARRPTARPSASSARSLAGWAYGAIYRSSQERTAALDGWLLLLQPSPPTLSPRPPTPG